MRKAWLIGWKDVTLAFRDVAALLLMLVAPFSITLGMGFATGHFSGTGGSAVQNIPVVIVNQDEGQLGGMLVDLFQSPELSDLVAPTIATDVVYAHQEVDKDRVAAAVIVPRDFAANVAAGGTTGGHVATITIYANPLRPTNAGVIRAMVGQFVDRAEMARVAVSVSVTQLASQGLITPADAPRLAAEIGARQARLAGEQGPIAVRTVTTSGEAIAFDVLAYMAPSMALMFLMFTAAQGARSLLVERAQGTLSRLLTSPTRESSVLAGKMCGTYLTGVAQMVILIGASAVIFRLKWGDPLGVLVLILAAVAGATGWGILITMLARTPGQVSAMGSAVMLTFGILGGSFINPEVMPAWFRILSRITPNSWGLDGFATLALGGRLGDVLTPVLALLVMCVVILGVAVLLARRRSVSQS